MATSFVTDPAPQQGFKGVVKNGKAVLTRKAEEVPKEEAPVDEPVDAPRGGRAVEKK